jgi:chromosome partitioning protein
LPIPTSSKPNGVTITSLNLKGGVGKTHLCWLLASVCQERKKPCLIIDLDQQANITESFLPKHEEATGVELIFERTAEIEPRKLVHKTAFSHIHVIPATGHFARFDGSQPDHWEAQRLHAALAEVLAELAPRYDYVLLDCPPRISLASYSALCASHYVLIPLEAADWGARGTATVRAAIERVQQHDNPELRLLGYVISKFKRQRAFQLAYLNQIRETFGDDAFQTVIPDSAQFERSVDDAIPTTLHSPSSNASRIARSFFDEFESRIRRASAQKEHPRIRGDGCQVGSRPKTTALARQ